MAILMFKAFHSLLQISMQNLFQIHINIRSSRTTNMFSIKYSRSNLRRQCASNAGIRLWNALPDDITNYLQYIYSKDISSPVICIVVKLSRLLSIS